MQDRDQREARNACGLLIALTALLCFAVIGFHLTGPVNKVPTLANAPPADGVTIGQHR